MRMTADEIKLVAFVLVMLLLGSAAKYYRVEHPTLPMSTPLPKRIKVGQSGKRL